MVMIAPVNPNAIEVSLVQTGCCTAEFDSTYPVHLHGIIRQDEFQESIRKINETMSSKKSMIICALLSAMCLATGMILFIAGITSAASAGASSFSLLVGIGFGCFALGMCVMSVGCFFVQSRRLNQMRQAVAAESIKYATRSPTPCSWRLDTSRVWTGYYRSNQRMGLVYRLLIEIAHPNAPATVNVPYQFHPNAPPVVTYYAQPEAMPPPPYYEQPTTGFCSQCGKPRESAVAKFCTACGQPFSL